MRLRLLTAGNLLAAISAILGICHDDHAFADAAALSPASRTSPSAPGEIWGPRELQLEVFINGRPTGWIAEFNQEADGTLLIEDRELQAVGIRPAEQARRPDGRVAIAHLPDVSSHYQEGEQSIYFTAGPNALAPRVFEAQTPPGQPPEADQSVGGLVNYTLYASTGGQHLEDLFTFEGISGWFEGRLFGPFGLLTHSQIARSSLSGQDDFTRLDTSWSYSDPRSMVTYSAGDLVSGGLSWTRPVRLGGVQIRRNFRLRPDLVTMPMPVLSGSAAVPSTVEVYVENARRLSQEIEPGPFEIVNLPVVTGAGTARIVLRDALGRETVSEQPFFASTDLLAPGLWDFSAEAGVARRFYGIDSNNYDDTVMASGSLRYGFSERLALEGHAEAGGELLNGGVGAVTGIGSFGVGSLAGAASAFKGSAGFQIFAGIEGELWGLHLHGRTQRTFGDYLDLAAVTAADVHSGLAEYSTRSSAPPRALDQLSLSVPLRLDPATINISYTQFETAERDWSRILGLSFSRPIRDRASFFASAYVDFEAADSYGIFAGLSLNFGGSIRGSLGATYDAEGATITTELAKSGDHAIGSLGWRIRDSEGARTNRHAALNYRASFAEFEAGIEQYEDAHRVTAQMDGAVVFAGGGVFLSNRIHDGFAIVDAGAPGVEVSFENRPVGQTDRNGKLLLADLLSYQPNRITIDPTDLPLDAAVEGTRQVAVPADRSGTVIRFDIDPSPQAALVTLRDEEGRFIETGSVAHLDETEGFLVGYDGQAYISGLGAHNTVIVKQPTRGSCVAEFAFSPVEGQQVTIPDVICRAAK